MSKFWPSLNQISRSLAAVCKGAHVLSASVVFILMVVVGLSVIFRYIVNMPLLFVDDLCGLLYVALTFLALAYVFVDKRHIRITFLFNRLPERAQNYLEIAGCLVTLFFLGLFGKEGWVFFYTSYQLQSASETASIPLAPWLFLMPLTLAIFGSFVLVFTIQKVHALVARNRGQP